MARIKIGNIKGPAGPKGATGATGPIGPVGPQGPLPPLANNFLATVAGKSALDAVAGKTLKDQLDQQNSDMNGAKLRIGNTHISSNEDGTFQLVHNADMTNYIMLARFGGNTANYITFGGTIDANNAYGVVRDANGKGFAFSGSIFWISIGFSPAI